MFVLLQNHFCCYSFGGGTLELITAVAYRVKTSEERRGTHTWERGASIRVPGRRVPAPIVLVSVLNGRVLDGN
jgi:hypothetical protein